MSRVLCCILIGTLVFFPEIETTTTAFILRPPNPSYAVEGKVSTLKWNYTLDGRLIAVKFSNVTRAADELIGSRVGPGKINITEKLEARFRAQAESSGADLTIQAVKLSDQGKYKLIVVSGVSGTFLSDCVQVIVLSPANNIVTSNDQTITAPTKLILKCSADGKPKPTITWTRVSDNTVVSMPLNITWGKKEESYRCTAYNGVGNPLTKVVKIGILFPPKVTAAQKVYVCRGQSASLNCEVKGNPTPTISWSPCDGENLLCNKQYLSIPKVQTARANYTCTATNALGVDSATTVLFIGGRNIYLRLSVSGECDNKESVWETLEKELPRVFANTTHNYSGAELLNVSCRSLIFDVVVKFSSEVAEDDIISLIQKAVLVGNLGVLSVHVSYVTLNPHGAQTTVTSPTNTDPKSDNIGLIIGVVFGSVAFVALIVFIVWCVRKKKCCSETKDKTHAAQRRKGKEQGGADEVAYASTSMLSHSKRPVQETDQSRVQVDKAKKSSNKGAAAQQRPCGEQDAEVEHVKRSFTEKSPVEFPNVEYASAL
ncbi:uncharacterized protein LOC141893174 [Acropora palmata]|uniref:uncharacterized protein LOC141893174 n=1 Tax=Acropora palmata TaxID=6131 RepID=UPI003DA02086